MEAGLSREFLNDFHSFSSNELAIRNEGIVLPTHTLFGVVYKIVLCWYSLSKGLGQYGQEQSFWSGRLYYSYPSTPTYLITPKEYKMKSFPRYWLDCDD